jgi:hypothetical protein
MTCGIQQNKRTRSLQHPAGLFFEYIYYKKKKGDCVVIITSFIIYVKVNISFVESGLFI